jgi:hypothetical protein
MLAERVLQKNTIVLVEGVEVVLLADVLVAVEETAKLPIPPAVLQPTPAPKRERKRA